MAAMMGAATTASPPGTPGVPIAFAAAELWRAQGARVAGSRWVTTPEHTRLLARLVQTAGAAPQG